MAYIAYVKLKNKNSLIYSINLLYKAIFCKMINVQNFSLGIINNSRISIVYSLIAKNLFYLYINDTEQYYLYV